jgi:hypothetical protein
MHLEGVIFDDGAGPHLAHEVVFTDHLASGSHQSFEHVKGPAADRNRGATHPQLTPAQVDRPPAGFVNSLIWIKHLRPWSSGFAALFGHFWSERKSDTWRIRCSNR